MIYILIVVPFFAALLEAPIWTPVIWGILAAPFVRRQGMHMARDSSITGSWEVMSETPIWVVAAFCIVAAYIGYLIGLGFEVAYTKLFLSR